MENLWGILIPAALTALTTLVTVWVSSRKRPNIAERAKPYADAMEQLDEGDEDWLRLKNVRSEIVRTHHHTHIAATYAPARWLLIVMVGFAVPILAASAVYFWQLIASPSTAWNLFSVT